MPFSLFMKAQKEGELVRNMEKETIYVNNKFKLERILADKTIPPGAKLILLNLLHRKGGKNYAFPSQKTIARDIGLGERQIRNHLMLLREKGVISWSRGAKNPKTGSMVNSNNYDLSNLLMEVKK